MNNRNNASNLHSRVRKMTEVAFLAALIVVLQLLSYFIKLGPFNMSFVLIPIVIGGILYGQSTGAFLGGVFGLVVTIACVAGLDQGGFILFSANPFFCILICMAKGILCGLLSALVFKLLSKGNKKSFPAMLISAGICPIVNTALFCIGMTVFYYDTLLEWAGGTAVFYYMFTALIGINFVIEFLLNLILGPSIAYPIIKMKNN